MTSKMTVVTSLLLLFGCLASNTLAEDPEASMKVPEIIAYWGYPCEQVQVTTDDDYILTMHRIPFGRSEQPNNRPKPVAFLQHGLEGSSSSWVTNLPGQSLAFILADAGFDVWMGNVRGNLYSIAHKTLDPKGHEFWQFSFDQMNDYDLPAMVNYVLSVTNQTSLYYAGHSQGTLIMFNRLGYDPAFNDKIRLFFALAPIGEVTYIKGLLHFIADDFWTETQLMLDILGQDQFLPESGLLHEVAKLFCTNAIDEAVCGSVLFLLGGPESNQMNETRLPVYLADEPSGTSTQNILHWAQMVRQKKQQRYDWGSDKANKEHYNQTTPPQYDISGITAPILLYWSPSDWLADQKDVEGHLLVDLPSKAILQNKELTDFNHFDFIWGLNAPAQIYSDILNKMLADVRGRGGSI